MASLAESPDLVGFFSYSRRDDEHSQSSLSQLRARIYAELRLQLGRDFRLWQDVMAIPDGTLWEDEIKRGIAESVFFIPIVTPSAIGSKNCRFEFESFRQREASLGRNDLIFPILYITVDALEKEERWRQDEVLKVIGERQYLDWRKLRFYDHASTKVGQEIERYCQNITNALRKPWASSDVRFQKERAEVMPRAGKENRRTDVGTETTPLASEQPQAREVEAARLAERLSEEEQQSYQRAELPATKVTATANKPNKAALLTTVHPPDAPVDQLSARPQRLAPPTKLQPTPAMGMTGGVLAALVIVAVLIWAVRDLSPSTHDAFVAPAPSELQPSNQQVSVTQAAPSVPAKKSPPAPATQSPPIQSPPANSAVEGPVVQSSQRQSPSIIAPASPSLVELAWALLKDTTDEATLKRFAEQFSNSPLRNDADARIASLAAVRAAKPVPPSPDQLTWELLKETTDERALQRFKTQFPDSPLRKDADARIAALAAAQAAKPVPPSPDQLTWALLRETTDEGALQRFKAQFPDSPLRKDVDARIAALRAADALKPQQGAPDQTAWGLVKDSRDPNELRRFIRQFPSSANRTDAEQQILSLEVVGPRTKPVLPTTYINNAVTSCRASPLQRTDAVGGPQQPEAIFRPNLSAARALRAVAISPNGANLLTAGDDAIIRVWNAENLKWSREIHGHTDAVYSLAFSDDGELLASASWDGTVRIWDAGTFALMKQFTAITNGGRVKQWAVAFEPGRGPQHVASAGDDGSVWMWDLRGAADVSKWRGRESDTSPIRSISFAPNGGGSFMRSIGFHSGAAGPLVTAAFDGNVRFFSEPGEYVAADSPFPGPALHVGYSTDGKMVASAGADDSQKWAVRIWDSASHALSLAFETHRGHAASIAWSADSAVLASGGGYLDPTVRLWDSRSGRRVQEPLNGHTKDVEALAFHPNRKWVISASQDATVKIWDIATGKELLTVVGFPEEQYLAYTPNGCFTGSPKAPNYVRYVTKDAEGHEHDANANYKEGLFVPIDSAEILLPH